ncbi:YtxH domain-containing protein [Tenacibaculum ascidiaceicola]|uniref:YtxH domain-containing protein n=1 Tax=Tenacibaculum ascidiaceicola TaxID=1699411 RepID=UPI0039E919A4
MELLLEKKVKPLKQPNYKYLNFNVDEEKITIEEAINELDESIKSINSTTKSISKAQLETQQLINALNDDSGHWISDHIFRPDNPKRKKEALDSLKTLKSNLEKAEKLSFDAGQVNLPNLRSMANTVKTWPGYFTDLKPVLNTNITIIKPNKEGNIIGTIQFFVGTFVGGSWKLYGWAKNSRHSFIKGYLIGSLITGFIGSIFSAEKRKATFEEIKKNATEANGEVLELIDNLEEINEQVESKFRETNQILEEAKFAKKGSLTSQIKTLEALTQASLIIKDWSASYKAMLKKIEKGRKTPSEYAYDTAEDIVYKEEAVLGITFDNENERIDAIQKVFYLTYLLDWKNDGPGYEKLKNCIESDLPENEKEAQLIEIIQEIGNEVQISEEQTNFILIRALLILGLNPSQIIKITNIIGVLTEKETIDKIEFFKELSQVA